MSIIFHEGSKTFHLFNEEISYIICVLSNGHIGNLYFGKKIHDREDFSYLIESKQRPMTACVYEGNRKYSLEHLKLEYPVYGTSDYRNPAVEILQENGSRISEFKYISHEITDGKPELAGLPATYVEEPEEAQTLCLRLKDEVTGIVLELLYSIFSGKGILARSARFINEGIAPVHLLNAMSLSLDLPDSDYVWMQFSGVWARERHIIERKLEQGIQAVGSIRGNSSHEHNPFIVLRRPSTTETSGEVMGFSLIYSGNHRMQAEVDTHNTTRVTTGINPQNFDWKLDCGESFQTPEAVVVFSNQGLNGMSQTFHKLYQKRLVRGYWRDRPRPVLNNNWEATYFDFTEDRLVEIAAKAKECGVELFVLDDGWFGKRSNDYTGLGDWVANKERLPFGIKGLADRIEEMGMKFGLWFEPEMVNKDSDLYRAHPDWILHAPQRASCHGRNQYVLDFSRKEVVDCIYDMMYKILSESKISYIKWDMNRSITECYSVALPADRQGEVFHRYILGVYDLYERLTTAFPQILFESCASGGGRFDPGMLYYAPQGWTSDDTDAIERLKIQYGTSMVYPVSCMGSHVSASPNHQTNRVTPLETRADVAYFGTFGYELDLLKLGEEDKAEIRRQIAFMKEKRDLIQKGTFYRLKSPFEGNETAWMIVSEDQKKALVGYYRVMQPVNVGFKRLKLKGLKEDTCYKVSGYAYDCYGDELMQVGMILSDSASGVWKKGVNDKGDFQAEVFEIVAV